MDRWQSVEDELRRQPADLLPIRLRLQTAVTIYLRNRSKRMPEAASLHSRAQEGCPPSLPRKMSHAASLCDAVDLLATAR